MTYSKGPYDRLPFLPPPTVTKLHSSRKVDFATKRYVIDDDGNPEAQSSIQQVVAMKVAFNVPNPDFNTFSGREQTRQDVLVALRDLQEPGQELIKEVSVTFAASDVPGERKGVVTFLDVSTGRNQTVEI